MEKHKHGFTPILCLCVVVSLGLFSVASCIAAEFKRAKLKDLQLDGRLCCVPRSHAFWFGVAALICWSMAQMIGNLMVWWQRDKTPMISTLLLSISWISFGIGMILLGSATSMSGWQEYGEGWLDGECYIVKDGIFIGSATLALLSVSSLLASAKTFKSKKTQFEQESTVNQQLAPKF